MADLEDTFSDPFESCSDNDETSLVSDENAALYNQEPEYTVEEMNLRELNLSSDSSCESDDNLDSSRLENLHWCTCSKCQLYDAMSLEEAKCCRECGILNEKLETVGKCITEHDEFEILCLNKIVLETACLRHRRYKKIFTDVKTFTNKQLRYSAYRQYTAWTHYYESLGRGCRVVIPSCVVKSIREEYPEASGIYTGFKNLHLDN